MSATRFTKENLPQSSEELKRILATALENVSPADDFVQLVRELAWLEQKHGMDSAEFYEKYQRGEMGDAMEIMEWASKYRIYREMKETHKFKGRHLCMINVSGEADAGDFSRDLTSGRR